MPAHAVHAGNHQPSVADRGDRDLDYLAPLLIGQRRVLAQRPDGTNSSTSAGNQPVAVLGEAVVVNREAGWCAGVFLEGKSRGDDDPSEVERVTGHCVPFTWC